MQACVVTHDPGMTARAKRTELRSALGAFATGADRSPRAVESLARLVVAIDDVPWRDELVFVLANYSPTSDATGEEPLTALAQLVLDDWATKKPEPRWRLRVPTDAKGLDARWKVASGRERAAAVVLALTGRGDLRSLAFGEHEGRLDFRGFVDPAPEPTRPTIVSLENLDFSGSRFGPLRFDKQAIRQCRFDGTVFSDFRLWSTPMSDCSFRGADFGDTVVLFGRAIRRFGPLPLGNAAPARHARVDFSESRLSNAWFSAGGFEDCDFSNAHLSRTMFECDVIRCRFAGHLHEVAFFGHPGVIPRTVRLEQIDLRAADLHWVDFRGVDLDAFALPDDPQLRIVENWPCVRRALAASYPDEASQPRGVSLALAIIGSRVDPLPSHGRVLVELRTLEEEIGSAELASLMGALDDASAGCETQDR